MIYDAVIAGAGPAGSTAGYYLSKAGLNVLVLDKCEFPRYKACGGLVSKKILNLTEFDLTPVAEEQVSNCYVTYKSSEPFQISMGESMGYLASRDKLDFFLLEKAVSAGAKFISSERVTGFHKKDNIYNVETGKGVYKTRYLIGADGNNSIIRKKSGLAHKIRRYLTLTAELTRPKYGKGMDTDAVWFDLGDVPHGYGWIFPKADFLTLGMGLFYNVKRKIKKDPKIYLYDFYKKNKLTNNLNIEKVRGCFISTLIDERSSISSGGVFLAGEAAGLVDPFTGEGIYHAIYSSKILSEFIINNFDHPEIINKLYKKRIKDEVLSEFKIAERLAVLVYTFPRLCFNILQDYRHLGSYYYQLLVGNVSYKDLYARLIDKVKKRAKNKLKSIMSLSRQ
ncbi:MAG: geranylgeranyl reductase family protein [Armatimonadota bacterium]